MPFFDEGVAVTNATSGDFHTDGARPRLGNHLLRDDKFASRSGDLNGLHGIWHLVRTMRVTPAAMRKNGAFCS